MTKRYQFAFGAASAAVLVLAGQMTACSPAVDDGDGDGREESGGRNATDSGGSGGQQATGGRGGNAAGASGSSGATAGRGGSAAGNGGSSAGSGGRAGSDSGSSAAGRGGSGSGAAGSGSGAAGSGGAAGSWDDPVAANGTEYFMGVCSACHGSDGKGRASLGPEILHMPRAYATWVIRNGRKHPTYPLPMEAYPAARLSDAFLNEMFTLLDAPPKPTTGEALYHDYCENCHGKDGKGTLVGHGVAQPLSKYTEMVRAGHGGTDYSNRTSYMPSWTPQQLSDADVTAIFNYASKL